MYAARGFRTLEEALFGCLTTEEIRGLGGALDVDLPPRKQEMVAAILTHMGDAYVGSLWARLTDIEKSAVSEAAHSPDGCHHDDRFRAKYGQYAPFGNGGRKGRAAKLELFFFGPDRRMPDDLVARMKRIAPPPPPIEMRTLEAVPTTTPRTHWERTGAKGRSEQVTVGVPVVVREMEVAAQRNLKAVLKLVERGQIAVSDRTSRPTAATTRRIAAVLEGGDFYATPGSQKSDDDDDDREGPIQAFAWPLLLQAAGFARNQGTHVALTRKGLSAREAATPDALRQLWNAWMKWKIFDEYSRVESVKGQKGAMSAVAPRRDAVADGLAECPVGRWVAVGEFWRFLRADELDFTVSRNDWRLYICDRQYGSLGDTGRGNWSILQGRYVLALLFEYAATLGMIDVAYGPAEGGRFDYRDMWGTDDLSFLSRYDGLSAFRLTPLGAFCLGTTDEHPGAGSGAFPSEYDALVLVPPRGQSSEHAETTPGDDRP